MIPFFDTSYTVRRPQRAVFELFSDFSRYLTELPEFHGTRLLIEPGPRGEGRVCWLEVPGDEYQYRTRVEVIEQQAPDRFVYDYQYTTRDHPEPLPSAEGPMPWDRARMILTFEDLGQSTRVRARMQVFGVTGFFQRWKVSTLKTACARSQRNANANMVRIAENLIPNS
ncbi:SRPBCC family protein [Marinimicrobium agarilyticum]|uniref:SRPBCC family protein n=1 Tax=Marinimicrobium agarilyticum TaxID=306546 RepID=UPI0004817E94|nr:SRPBCC family protein [Marinimicrobium agarilyticum]